MSANWRVVTDEELKLQPQAGRLGQTMSVENKLEKLVSGVLTTKCDGCGLESEQKEIFQSVPRSFSTKLRTLCPACFAGKDDKVLIVLFWSYVALLFVAVLLTVFLPSISLGPWLVNIALFQPFVFICTIIHELGHAWAGRLVGFRIFGIEIGHGRVISEFPSGGIRWQFRTVLLGGCVHGTPRNTKYYKLRESLFILGGPLANVVLIAVAFWALPLDAAISSGSFKSCAPVLVFMLSNASLLANSLWPYRFETRHGKIPNDILLLWETWRRPKAEVEQMPAHWFFLEAEESQRQGNYEMAREWIESGRRLYPKYDGLEWLQAYNLIQLRRYGEARTAYVLLLGRYGKFEEMRVMLFNNIAYADLLSGDARLLDEAEVCSRLALEKHPWNCHFKGTRGSVLIEMGEYDEGLKLLHQALKQHTERQGRALNACFIAIAEARRGRPEESRNFFAIARTLDPKCFLLERESQWNCTRVNS